MLLTDQMNSTEDAISFGKTATKEEIEKLKIERKHYTAMYNNMPENASVEELNILSNIAFKGQLAREALGAAGVQVL